MGLRFQKNDVAFNIPIRDVQKTAMSFTHKYGMRISHVNAWNTSKLAYDSNGNVKSGEAGKRRWQKFDIHQVC